MPKATFEEVKGYLSEAKMRCTEEIVNYFVYRFTNVSAESLNSKIKNFRAQLHEVVDVEFFLYRLSLIYA